MAKSKQDIISAIDAYMQKFNYKNSDWYVGIAANPENRLFNDHNVEKDSVWIYEQAYSDSIARDVEQTYINTGHDGGSGGGNEESVYVYAYVKLGGTVR